MCQKLSAAEQQKTPQAPPGAISSENNSFSVSLFRIVFNLLTHKEQNQFVRRRGGTPTTAVVCTQSEAAHQSCLGRALLYTCVSPRNKYLDGQQLQTQAVVKLYCSASVELAQHRQWHRRVTLHLATIGATTRRSRS